PRFNVVLSMNLVGGHSFPSAVSHKVNASGLTQSVEQLAKLFPTLGRRVAQIGNLRYKIGHLCKSCTL
ncbi:MAG: hypothetical protein KDI79_09505, partial [Anaerolineae bacterium]|nr:hypothetical protein [Anaerolineae bacterium]